MYGKSCLGILIALTFTVSCSPASDDLPDVKSLDSVVLAHQNTLYQYASAIQFDQNQNIWIIRENSVTTNINNIEWTLYPIVINDDRNLKLLIVKENLPDHYAIKADEIQLLDGKYYSLKK